MNKKSTLSKKTKQQMVLPSRKVNLEKTTIRKVKEEKPKRRVFSPPPIGYFPQPEQRRARKLYKMREYQSNASVVTVNRPKRITKEEMQTPVSPFQFSAPTLCSASSPMTAVSSCSEPKGDCGCGCGGQSKTSADSCGMQHQSCCCCSCCCEPHHSLMEPPPVTQNPPYSYPYPYEPEPGTAYPLV